MRGLLVLVLTLCVACGDDRLDSDASTSPDASDCPGCAACLADIDTIVACYPEADPEEVRAFREDCTSDRYFRAWTARFSSAYASCAADSACEDFDDLDDVCIPAALAAVSSGELPEELLMECASGSSEECRTMILSGGAGEAGVVSACLAKWAGCGDAEFGANYWTEDHCLILLGLDSSAVSDAVGCIALSCEAAGACLDDARILGF